MPEIFVNDVPHAIDNAPPTWGELLDSLDRQAAGQGVLLTAARFDGVDEPSFREPEVTARRLSDLAKIEIETAPPAAFLRAVLLESLPPLEQAAGMAIALSGRFRGTNLSGCHDALSALANELRGLTTLVAMLGSPLQIDLGPCIVEGLTIAQQLEEFAMSLDQLVQAQEAEDWLTVADILEYDVEPAIRRWVQMIMGITEHLAPATATK